MVEFVLRDDPIKAAHKPTLSKETDSELKNSSGTMQLWLQAQEDLTCRQHVPVQVTGLGEFR